MPDANPVNWQPISQMPLIASMIDGALDDTRDHVGALSEARARPHVLDDAMIDQVERVHTEQLEFVDIYDQQISPLANRKAHGGSNTQTGPDGGTEPTAAGVTMEVLALAGELRKGSD